MIGQSPLEYTHVLNGFVVSVEMSLMFKISSVYFFLVIYDAMKTPTLDIR